jgi:hypothetical protein
VEEAEEAIYKKDLTDLLDVLQQMMNQAAGK